METGQSLSEEITYRLGYCRNPREAFESRSAAQTAKGFSTDKPERMIAGCSRKATQRSTSASILSK